MNSKVDEAVEEARETTTPRYIRHLCTPHQERVWSAISFLLKTHPRDDFGLREIAQEARLKSYPRVSGWIDDLVEMGVLVQIAPEQRDNGSRENFLQIRSKYAIPWAMILNESLKLAERYVEHHVRGGNRLLPNSSSGSGGTQLALDLGVTDRSHEGVTDRSHEGVTDRSHEGVTDRSQSCDPSITASCDPLVTPGWMDGSIVGMDGSGRAGARKRNRQARPGRPPSVPPPPPAEIFAAHPAWVLGGPLSAHPRDLWRVACPTARPVDDQHLASLALEHDEPTGGHGWYWVGRAILAVSLERDARSVAIVRNTMIRWREEDSYGSDRPSTKEKEVGSERPARARSARPAAAPRRDGPPPGLKLAGRRNGAAASPDGGEPA